MDSHSELGDFSGLCRLFPLPGVVLFPHVILPLHIFEPRYRQMTEDALEGDRLITIVQAAPRDTEGPETEPVPILNVACIGKIIQHERLPDGRFNMLLLGCNRARLIREVPCPHLYRLAEAAILSDEEPCASMLEGPRSDLIAMFLEVLRRRHRLDPDLAQLLESDIKPGILSDMIAHALDLAAPMKQALLEETRVDRRMTRLIALMEGLLEQLPRPRRFPQPFSLN